MWLENWSLHFPCRHDELLPQKDVLGQQLGAGAQQVTRETTNDRARPPPQRFVDSFRGGGESQPHLASNMSEHETDLLRDHPQLQAPGEILNDPRAEERSSQDRRNDYRIALVFRLENSSRGFPRAALIAFMDTDHQRKLAARFKSLSLALAVVCAFAARPARADGREFRPNINPPVVPTFLHLSGEAALGDAWSRSSVGPAATAEVAFIPGFRVSDFDFDPVVRGLYLNPHFDLALGGRIGSRVSSVLDGLLPISLLADVTYLTVHSRVRAAAGAQFGLGTLLNIGVWGGRETVSNRWYANLALSTDLMKWGDPIGAILELTPIQDPGRGQP